MSFRVSHCHVDVSWHWPHVQYLKDEFTTLVTFEINSLWGSVLLGGGYFWGVKTGIYYSWYN